MREVTLLCSAAATGLSDTARALDKRADISAVDLEDVLKSDVVDWTQYVGSPRNMGTICSLSPRDAVLNEWMKAFPLALEKLQKPPHTEHNVLACHLTLFSPTRLELYSPPILRALSEARDIHIRRVVVLIDDIYDMLVRLSAPGNIYDRKWALEEHQYHSNKLTNKQLETEKVLPFSESDLATLGIELTVKNLMRLLHWRRSEMIAAEELARNLDTSLTVLAVKHELETLVSLVSSNDKVPVYLSHKITEPRGWNSSKRLTEGVAGAWPPFVEEVNALSASYRDAGLLLIQPTAIDELRFTKHNQEQDRLNRYSGTLGDRWPVPKEAIYAPIGTEAPNYEHLIDGERTDHDMYRHGLFGLLQHTIYDEIAFRDHLLVSCNDGLLVYRVAAMDARVSGGVEEEISHWVESSRTVDGRLRPAGFIHTTPEILSLIEQAPRDSMRRVLRERYSEVMRAVLADSGVSLLWERCVKGSTPLAEVQTELSVHLRRRWTDIQPQLESALGLAVCYSISSLCRVDGSAASRTAHFVGDDEDECVSVEFVNRVATFFREPKNSIEDANTQLLESLKSGLRTTSTVNLVRTLAKYKVVK